MTGWSGGRGWVSAGSRVFSLGTSVLVLWPQMITEQPLMGPEPWDSYFPSGGFTFESLQRPSMWVPDLRWMDREAGTWGKCLIQGHVVAHAGGGQVLVSRNRAPSTIQTSSQISHNLLESRAD